MYSENLMTQLVNDDYNRRWRKPNLEQLYSDYVGYCFNMKEKSDLFFEDYKKEIQKILQMRKEIAAVHVELENNLKNGKFVYNSVECAEYYNAINDALGIVFRLAQKLHLRGYAYDCLTNPKYNP